MDWKFEFDFENTQSTMSENNYYNINYWLLNIGYLIIILLIRWAKEIILLLVTSMPSQKVKRSKYFEDWWELKDFGVLYGTFFDKSSFVDGEVKAMLQQFEQKRGDADIR